MRIARASVGGHPVLGEVDGGVLHVLAGQAFEPAGRTGEQHPLDQVALQSPVTPGRTFAVLGGFLEPGTPRDDRRGEPLLSPKMAPTTSGDGAEIVYPPFATSVLIEAEMAVVVGRPVRSASPAEAADAIWGYTCCNDVTAPQYFPQFYLAKSIDTFASMGPWVRTDLPAKDIRRGLAIVARVNGATVQSGSTAHYRFEPCEVVSYLSGFFSLLPGDVITLGTPPAPPEVHPGDLVEIEVEGIGVLTNRVVATPAG